jgi:hypothetical protein
MILIRFKLTEADLFNFNYYTQWAAPGNKSHRFNFYLSTFSIPLAFVVVIIVSERFGAGIKNFFVLLTIAGAMGLFFIYNGIDRFKRRIQKLYSDENNFSFFTEKELTIDNSGIIERGENSESRINWRGIIKKVETKEYFYLYLNTVQAIIIPKSCLNSDQTDKLRMVLSEHLSLKAEFNQLYI